MLIPFICNASTDPTLVKEHRVTHHLDAFDDPPDVRAFEGEILVTGSLVNAAYTVKAAHALIVKLQRAVREVEGSTSANDPEPEARTLV